ncbi:MAG TPA: DNA-binding protein WhiA, partial [Bacilli bacterium]|nr:DNA-binding protein WhiA [Bacilli bacterium]
IYIKKSDQISEFLIFVGASNASLEYESIRIDRDMQNITNRMFICDNANYQKTVKSANEQIANIEIVSKYYGEKPLGNEKLGALMKLRLEHEDANLQELADLLSEKLNTEKPISKGNINHLFIKLKSLAEPYKNRG